MIVHDLKCVRCNVIVHNHVFPSIADVDVPLHCVCGDLLYIYYNPSYNRAFNGANTELARDRIVVWRGPSGDIAYPGRTDDPMTDYPDYERVELAPSEITSFERDHHVAVQSLHWNSSTAPQRMPYTRIPQISFDEWNR